MFFLVSSAIVCAKSYTPMDSHKTPEFPSFLNFQGTIEGYVTDESGIPMLGVNVLVEGTKTGVSTDFDGHFEIAASPGDNIVVSYLGFLPQTVKIDSRKSYTIVLKEDVSQLDEVVVTALGITREEKSLGYSVGKVGGEEVNKTVSGNWLNGMSGKVPGLTFAQAGTGPSGSIRVTLRGDQSLNYGSNEALFVIDGVPVNSGMTSTRAVSNYAQADAPVDYGNGMSDLNPEDIASVSVLKGPAAAALYGSRAANGAIIITTKGGGNDKFEV